ncbi:MAG: hypothetical protein ACI9K3_001638, partial [Halovenus sp.]
TSTGHGTALTGVVQAVVTELVAGAGDGPGRGRPQDIFDSLCE